MANNGGRFIKGDPRAGRKVGSKDRLPRTAKAAVRVLLEQFGNDVELIKTALTKGLQAKPPSSFPYLKLIVEQHAGLPDQTVDVVTRVIHEHHTS